VLTFDLWCVAGEYPRIETGPAEAEARAAAERGPLEHGSRGQHHRPRRLLREQRQQHHSHRHDERGQSIKYCINIPNSIIIVRVLLIPGAFFEVIFLVK